MDTILRPNLNNPGYGWGINVSKEWWPLL
jgi:hypothetical protein